MESLLDYDGPWSPDVINLMTPMAEEAELAEQERTVEAVSALLGKDSLKSFLKRGEALRKGILARGLAARGAVEAPSDTAAEAMRVLEQGFAGLGAKKPKGRGRR